MPDEEKINKILIILGKLEEVPTDIKDIYNKVESSNLSIVSLKSIVDLLKNKIENVEKCTDSTRQHYEECQKERIKVEGELSATISLLSKNSEVNRTRLSFTEKYMDKIINMGVVVTQGLILYLIVSKLFGG